MRFYPPNNEEIDNIQSTDYLKKILTSWRKGLNLVTRFDITKGKIYHIFMKAEKPDLIKGILRVWTKKRVMYLYDDLTFINAEQKSIFSKLDALDRVFNRNGKLYSELAVHENNKAYSNMLTNALEYFNKSEYIMAAYFAKGALLYKKTQEANDLLNKCRERALNKKAA
jgi:hypothetical protein